MPKLTIDGQEIEVAPGTRVIEAAKKCSIDVPYYCYHPGLSIAGNCRMCLVEIKKNPKLQIACHVQAQDGMVVKTNTEKIKKTRQHVLEFLLVNHPLDCPVCDQSGECWLQDYYMKYGLYDSRVEENKLKRKKATSIGPTVILDQDRCILCSRCVRFTDEISKTYELGMTNRGDHSVIELFPGKELNNKYSGNVVDICPVGALTDKDFRFKKRVWYLDSANSVCSGCARGCNIQIHYSTQRLHHALGERVVRLKPRYNPDVNQWWMCDVGRYDYKFHDHNRILEPLKRTPQGIQIQNWNEIIQAAAHDIQMSEGKYGIFISPQLSNEDIFSAFKLFLENLAHKNIFLVSPKRPGYEDDFLIRADKNPNSKGAEFQGLSYDEAAVKNFLEDSSLGKYQGLIVFGQDLLELYPEAAAAVKNLKWTIFIGSNHNQMSENSTYVLPSATHAEVEGTFTNFEGKIQRFERALFPLGESRPDWQIIVDLAKALEIHMHYDEVDEIFAELTLKVKPFEGLKFEELRMEGSDIRSFAAPTIPELQRYDNIL